MDLERMQAVLSALEVDAKLVARRMATLAGALAAASDECSAGFVAAVEPRRRPPCGQAQDVWDHFIKHRPPGRAPKLTAKRVSSINARIKDFGKVEVMRAVTRFLSPEFFWASPVGFDGKKKATMCGPDLCFRSTEQMEKILDATAVGREVQDRNERGERMLEGKIVVHASFHIPKGREGEYVVVSPGDPRLK